MRSVLSLGRPEEFANRVGFRRTYIGAVERGERNVGLVNVGRIAAALEPPISSLIAEAERSTADRRESG